MRLRDIISAAVVLGACATVNQQEPLAEFPQDVFCGTVRSYWMCIAQYPDAEVSYHRTIGEPSSCGVMIDYRDPKVSVLLKDYECDEAVDSYLRSGPESDVFKVRGQDEKLFMEEFDPLLRKYKAEILEAYQNGSK